MSVVADELRIIAADGGRLRPQDCALIAHAADVYEGAERMREAMLEAQAAKVAMQDRLNAVLRQNVRQTLQPMTFTIQVQGYMAK